MFNGIIRNTGIIKYIRKSKNSIDLTLQSKIKIKKNMLGSSISCDGVCLTLTSIKKNLFTF